MKQKRKHILKKLLIFSIAIMLASCSEDLYEHENSFNSQGIKISKVSVKESKVFSNSKLMHEIEKVKNKNFSNRIVYDSVNDFYFDDEKGMLIEKATGYKSYTFPVFRITNTENSKLENIIFSENENNEFDSYLVKYSFTNNELETSSYEELQGEQTNLIQLNRAMQYICITITTYGGCTETHSNGYTCSGETAEYDCYNMSGSSGSSGGDSSSGNGSGSISTVPISHEGGGNSTPPNPCKKLKNLFDPLKGNIKPTILNDLRPNIAVNPSGEKGYSLTKNSTGTILGVPILNSSIPVTQVPYRGYFFCAIHTHPLDTAPMFSFSDVLTLNNLNNGCASFNEGMASFLLVCQDDNGVFQTYAIVFDPVSVNETIDQFMTNPENIGCTVKEISENEKLRIAYNKEYNSPNPNYERVFLRSMYNSNVSLYKANSTLTNWSKLSLSNNSATATVNSTNCN